MKRNKKINFIKTILIVVVFLVIIGLILYLFPLMKNLSTQEGQVEFKKQIEKTGIWGFLTLFGLEIAKMFLIVIPGEPIELLAGMCYGGWGGFLFILISVILVTTSIILLVKKFGIKFVYNLCGEEKVKKIYKSKVFKNKKAVEWIVIILFLIPGTPKDLLVYISALLPIAPLKTIIICVVTRIPSIISSTFVGANLAIGDWKMSLKIYVITFVLAGVLIWVINKLDKTKTTEKILKTMKEDNRN